jgi:hypothetical protein
MRKMSLFPILNLNLIGMLLKFFEREIEKRRIPDQSEFKGGSLFFFPLHRRLQFRNIKKEVKEFLIHFRSFSHPYQVFLKQSFSLS